MKDPPVTTNDPPPTTNDAGHRDITATQQLIITLSIIGFAAFLSVIGCVWCAHRLQHKRRTRAMRPQAEGSAETAGETSSTPPQTAQVSPNMASNPSSQAHLVPMDSEIEEVPR